MDAAKFVRKKIEQDELCEICVEAIHVVDEFVKSTRYICVIERQGDHVVFVYSSKSVPCKSESDLKLEAVLAVDGSLRFTTEQGSRDTPGSQAGSILCLEQSSRKWIFELPQDSKTPKFIAKLKQANDLQSQNAAFGLPSTFSWLERYRRLLTGGSPVALRRETNPFASDTFNPLAHMQLEGSRNQSLPTASGFDDDFGKMKINPNGMFTADLKKSSSKDSLDLLDSGRYDMTESLDVLAGQHLAGAGVADSLKPMSTRETLTSYYLTQRESEFVDITPLRVFCGTWNVNGQNPCSLQEWLACDKEPPDIYAIGFQELDLSNQAYIFTDSVRETEWQDAVWHALHPRSKYRKVKSIRLVGVMLLVYIKDIHVEYLTLIDTESVPTGIMGMLGNKGGVGVRMSLHNTTLCFINSHLAAHQDEYDRRNQDTVNIEGKMRFKQFLPPLKVTDHDVVFWIGDLNYRVDLEISRVKDNIRAGMLHKILPHDQLGKQLTKHEVYKHYHEGEINFPPTYKYDTGTNEFDSSEKSRTPAWCDRVLWRGQGVRQIIYRSHPALKISDHKPVSGLFEVGIKVVDLERHKKVYEDIMKKLDKFENDYLPQVSLAEREFVFRDVKFIDPQEQVLAIANVGQVPVTYEFINKLDEHSYCKPWLKVTPCKSVISPGESCEIWLEVCVDKESANLLNSGLDTLEDILVLHLHGGKDFFIPISGNYIASSFGSSIEALIQMIGPIQEIPTAHIVNLERPGSLNSVDVLDSKTRLYICPKEIFRLVDHIHQYGRHQEDLFLQPGLNAEIQQIRDCLDTGQPDMIPGSIHSVCEALLLFLEALPEPVIPYAMYYNCLDCSNSYLLCKQVLSKVPDCHRNVFKYLCALLRDLLAETEYNHLDIKLLVPTLYGFVEKCEKYRSIIDPSSSMFGDVFLRAPPQTETRDITPKLIRRHMAQSEELKRAAFVYHFLVHEYDE